LLSCLGLMYLALERLEMIVELLNAIMREL
jgi:hypothetical protein